MELFISWSGDHSRRIAVALGKWIPKVIQNIRPWVSDDNIHSGQRWQTEIVAKLEQCSFGVVVVTATNQLSPWLQFEAGALSKVVTQSRVVPLLVDLSKSDLRQPLGMFQAELLTEAGIRGLMTAINAAETEPQTQQALDEYLDVWWPHLQAELSQIQPTPAGDQPPSRSERDLLEEVLSLVRDMRSSTMSESDLDLLDQLRYQRHRLDPEVEMRGARLDLLVGLCRDQFRALGGFEYRFSNIEDDHLAIGIHPAPPEVMVDRIENQGDLLGFHVTFEPLIPAKKRARRLPQSPVG